MTNKLYYSSPYLTKWSTKITDIRETDDGNFHLLLEDTAFYPEGGGQPADKGTINGIEVEDVQLIDDTIFHFVKQKPTEVYVECELDWKRRLDHMQQHTAQHLLSAVIFELYQIPTVSFHLGKEYTSIDIDTPHLTNEQLSKIEEYTNTYIRSNTQIKTYIIPRDQVAEIPLRKIPDITGDNIRIVEIEGIDYSACAGTHVQHTGELGIHKLIKTEKHRGQTRLFFLSGERALIDYQQSQAILEKLSNHFKTNRYELLNRIEKLENEKRASTKEITSLNEEINHYVIKDLLSKNESELISTSFENKPMKELTTLANQLVKQTSSVLLFSSEIDKKLLLQHNGDLSLHCGNFFKEYIGLFEGKGGGNNKLAQATFPTLSQLEQCSSTLQIELEKSLLK